ncbi:MAG: thiol-disulfide isomerase/thioredoxin [Cognaticolwellia sp.]|jgi:thiol-disulfide isomerase/thioredoxin
MLVVMALCLNMMAQMTFNEDDWSSILAEAKAQNKIVFVDAYTTWCGPCKMMSAQVFPDTKVGEFYNSNFINTKIDMEKGEGIDLAKKYNVRAYPTFLFVNGDGELVHRGIGFRPSAAFISLGEAASDPDLQLLGLKNRYKKGEREGTFMINYAAALQDGGMDVSEVSDEYLESVMTYDTPKIMEFIYNTTTKPSQKGFKIMSENLADFYKELGKEKVQSRMEYALQRAYFDDMDKMSAAYKSFFPTDSDRLIAKYKVTYYMYSRDEGANAKFAEAAITYLDKYESGDANELNSIAWHTFETTEDEALLKKACGWAEKSVKLEPSYYNMDTMANICFKLGKKRKAKKWAKKTIVAAEKQGESGAETKELLKQIKAL